MFVKWRETIRTRSFTFQSWYLFGVFFCSTICTKNVQISSNENMHGSCLLNSVECVDCTEVETVIFCQFLMRLARRGRISEDVAMLHISKWYSIASFYTKPDFTTQPQQNKCNNMQAKCRVSVILYLKQNIILILAHVRYFTWKM